MCDGLTQIHLYILLLMVDVLTLCHSWEGLCIFSSSPLFLHFIIQHMPFTVFLAFLGRFGTLMMNWWLPVPVCCCAVYSQALIWWFARTMSDQLNCQRLLQWTTCIGRGYASLVWAYTYMHTSMTFRVVQLKSASNVCRCPALKLWM
jgi:hypothetical protein